MTQEEIDAATADLAAVVDKFKADTTTEEERLRICEVLALLPEESKAKLPAPMQGLLGMPSVRMHAVCEFIYPPGMKPPEEVSDADG